MDSIKQLIIDTSKLNSKTGRRMSKRKSAASNLKENQDSDMSDSLQQPKHVQKDNTIVPKSTLSQIHILHNIHKETTTIPKEAQISNKYKEET